MLKSCRVHTTLPTADLARTRASYENTLEIPPKTELPSGIFYDCGEGTRFVLSQTAGKPSGAHTQMAFIVDDIDSEVEELKSRGVVFEHYDLPGLKTVEGIVHRPALKAAWFKDTDGNLLAIMQPVEPFD
jgi:catechol 2,3-dioxygenase-like lactoylglutathione lyase family enzyme